MRRALPLAIAATLVACSGSGGDAPDPEPKPKPRTASPVPGTTPPGLTAFAQTVPALDGLAEVFPGQANTWVIDEDFSLARGWGAQYSSALALYLGTPTSQPTPDDLVLDIAFGNLEPFPHDQQVSEVAWLTPLFGAADGVRTANVSDGLGIGVPALAGTYSGYLNGTSGSRLYRTLTLDAGAMYRLSWKDRATIVPGKLAGAASAPHAPFYQVVLRDPASGEVLQQLFTRTSDFGLGSPLPHDVELASTVSGSVQLSFELRSAAEGVAVVDDVVLWHRDVAVDGFDDGDFESGALGTWSSSAGADSQNVRSGARAVPVAAGASSPTLTVTRTFYAPPAATWARLVDVFENPSAARVVTTAVYWTPLLGTRSAIHADGKAIVGWDGDEAPSARDVAIVLGDGTAVVDPLSPDVFAVHALDVPAGGKVALVHYVVQLGTTDGGPTAADVPSRVGAEASAIAAGFRSSDVYVQDLERGVLDLVRNF